MMNAYYSDERPSRWIRPWELRRHATGIVHGIVPDYVPVGAVWIRSRELT